MAKRRRLNKRVAFLLVVIGAVMTIALVIGFLATRKKDPVRLARRGAAHMTKGEYQEASKAYGEAVEASGGTDPNKPKYLLEWGDVLLEWAEKDQRLRQSERLDRFLLAQKHYRKALDYDPNLVEAHTRLLDMADSMRRTEEIIAICTRLMKLTPEDHSIRYRWNLARASLVPGQPQTLDSVVKEFRDLVEIAPKEEKYWLMLAGFLHFHDRKEEAEQAYKDALAVNPGSVSIRIGYAYYLQRLDRRDEALPILAEVIRLQPKKVDGYLVLARFKIQDGKTDEGIQALNNAVKVDPVDFQAYTLLARISASKRSYDEAQAVLEKGLASLRKFADENPAMEGTTLAKYRVGVIQLNQQLCDVWLDDLQRRKLEGKEKVLKAVNQCLEIMREVDSNSPFIQKVLGRVALVENKGLEAAKLLRLAYDRNPGVDIRTGELLVDLYRRLGQPGDAAKIMHRFLAISKEDSLALATLARLHVDSRQYGQALNLIKDSLELDPENTSALSLRAALEIATGQSYRVPPGLKEVTAQAEALILERASQLWEESEPDKATQLAVDVLAKKPDSLSALNYLIRWYRELDRLEDARRLFQGAQKAFAQNPAALRALAIIVETDPAKRVAMRLAWASQEKDPLTRHLRVASVYKSVRNQQKYLEHIREAEKIDPENTAVIREMFYHYLRSNDLATAEKYLLAAEAKDLDGVGGRYLRAELAYADKKWQEGINLARKALEIRPRFTDAYVLLGNCYLALGNHEQARKEYHSALEQNRSNYFALLGLIEISRAAGNTGEYNQYVETAYKQNPRISAIREMYLQILEKQKRIDPEKLIKIREGILKDDPTNRLNLVQLSRLYELDEQVARAEAVHRGLAARADATHTDFRRLVMFLRRTDRDQEARSILAKYVAGAEDKVGAYLLWGDYLETVDELAQAEAAGLKAVETDPKSQRACLSMAMFYSRRGNWAKAAQFQEQYLAAAGDAAPPSAEPTLIRYMLEAGKTAESAARIEEALASNPNDAHMLALKGRMMFLQKKHTEAERLFAGALAVDAQNVQALLYRVDLHLARGQADKAEADLEQARRINATPAIVLRLSALYSRQQDFVRAHAVIQNLLEDMPDNLPLQREIVRLCMQYERWDQMSRNVLAAQQALPREVYFYKREAEMWLSQRTKDPRKAMLALDKASRLAPRDTETTLLMVHALLVGGRPDDAASLGESLRDHKAARPQALAVLARASLARNQPAAAEKDFIAALKEAKGGPQLSFVIGQVALAYPADKGAAKFASWASVRPDDWELAYHTGLAYSRMGDPKTAVKFYETAQARASTDPQRELILRELGMVYDQVGDSKKSLEAFQAVLKIRPNDGRTLNNLAWMLAKDPAKLDEAAECAKKASALLPNNAQVLDTYGTVLLAKEQYDQAKVVLRRSTDKEKFPANLLHYGMALEKLEDKAAAYGQYRQGWDMVKKDPRHPYYKDLKAGYERLGGTPAGRTTP